MLFEGRKVNLIFLLFLICAGGKKRKSHKGWLQLSNINTKNQYFIEFFSGIVTSNNAILENTVVQFLLVTNRFLVIS